MDSIRIKGQTAFVMAQGTTLEIDLTKALRVTMFDRTLTRPYTVSNFEAEGAQPLAHGVRVHLVNREEGLFIPLVFAPEPDGFRVRVLAGQINEQLAINRKILEVGLLPELMTSRVGDEGFFLLPDFSGTLARFKEHVPTVNRDRLYMEQPEWEKFNQMNCFAMRRGQDSVLAVVHRGDFFCHVVSELNQQGANRIYASFGLRHKDSEIVKQEDKEVVYRFLPGADWPELAKAYRQYLVEERGVSPLKARLADNPVLAYSVQAMRVKIFMGLKQPFTPDGSSPMKVHASFAEAAEILDAMWAAGLRKAVVTLVGWNLGGHDGAYPTRFPVEPALGGEEGLRKLIAKATSMGYQIVPHDNWTDVYRAAPDYDPEFVARTEDGEPRVVGIWGGGQAYKCCPVVALERYGLEFDRIKKLGFAGHYYMDAQASVLWRCHDPRHPADEEQFALSLTKLTQMPRLLYGAVATENGPAYTLPFVDEAQFLATPGAVEWPLQYCPESFKRIMDRVVPFYPLAVHGLITYQEKWIHGFRELPGGARQGWLRALAWGCRPCMEVSYTPGANGDAYQDSIRDVMAAYRAAFEELPDIHAETIESYEELSETAARVTFSNGVALAVNWGLKPDRGLEPLSYQVSKTQVI